MTREEALAHFERNYVWPKEQAFLRTLEERYRAMRDKLVPGFLDAFRRVCRQAGVQQAAGTRGPLGYITCAMLRTALADGLLSHRLTAQGREWYLDPVDCETEYDAAWAFCYLDDLGKELELVRKRYMNLILPPDIDGIKRRAAGRCNLFVVALARYAVPKAVLLPEYQALARAEVFEIRVGEHRDWTELVYKEDRREKDPVEVKQWLEAKEEGAYSYEVFAGLDLVAGDYGGIDLCFADLRGADLSGSNLREANLAGAKCSDAIMRGVNLGRALIRGADFQGANLQGAILRAVEGAVDPATETADTQEWAGPVLDGVCFAGADLTGVDFSQADLRGADFRRANLAATSFSDARLDGAVFSVDAAGIAGLTEEQRDVVRWE